VYREDLTQRDSLVTTIVNLAAHEEATRYRLDLQIPEDALLSDYETQVSASQDVCLLVTTDGGRAGGVQRSIEE
jgi:hypothetical protein